MWEGSNHVGINYETKLNQRKEENWKNSGTGPIMSEYRKLYWWRWKIEKKNGRGQIMWEGYTKTKLNLRKDEEVKKKECEGSIYVGIYSN